MKKHFFLVLFALISLVGCNQEVSNSKQATKPNTKAEIEKLNQALAQYDEKSHTFRVSGSQTSEVVGKAGTVLYINPANLETESGQAVQDSIEVELKELVNQSQLLRANAQTVSNGKMLVSGGAYYIGLKSKGQSLKLKKDKTLQVVFPKIDDAEMALFYGERDSVETMNWKETTQKLSVLQDVEMLLRRKVLIEDDDAYPRFDTLPIDDKRDPKIDSINKKIRQAYKKAVTYQPVELKNLGWINCDRFYDIPEKDKTKISLAFEAKDSIRYAKTFLVFQDINSVMQGYHINFENVNIKTDFLNIPLNRKVKFIAITQKNEELYGYESSFSVKSNETINIKLRKYSKEDLEKLFK